MEVKEIIADLRQQLSVLKVQSQSTVSIAELEKWLGVIETDAMSSIELRKLQQLVSLAEYDARIKSHIESFKATIESGRETLNSIVLINGGAVVAILGFLGAVAVKGTEAQLAGWLTLPLLLFGLGVLFGSFGFGLRYLSQALYTGKIEKYGNLLRYAAVLSAVAAYVCFALGVGNAYFAFHWRYMP
jgi:hypothetical protein